MIPSWTCPYCNRVQVVVDDKIKRVSDVVAVGTPPTSTAITAIACASKDCNRTQYSLTIWEMKRNDKHMLEIDHSLQPIVSRRILPHGSAKPQPAFIPPPLVQDYVEACSILADSPKAAATLARRCLQGMIRDFASISKPTLFEEISALRAAVDNGSADRSITMESVEAIDHVRGLGNIGAHMEKDINLIIPVDAGEAQVLIDLVEMLFDEWYTARHNRKARFATLAALAVEKKRLKSGEVPDEVDPAVA